MVYGLNLSMLDPVTVFAPESQPGDGVLWVVLVRGRITRLQLLRWFTALADGPTPEFLGEDSPLACVPVRAFRFEPLEPPGPTAEEPELKPPGILSLDAESVHFGPVQGRVVPRAARILAGEEPKDE